MSIRETSAGKRKILALVSFHSDIYARILRPFTFPRSMRQYAHERQASENNKQNTVSQKNKAISRKNTRERKSGRFRKRFSAKLRFALVFRSAFQFVLRRVLVWRSEATPLVIDKHTPQCRQNPLNNLELI